MEVLLNSFHFHGKDLKVRASDNRTGTWYRYLVPCKVNGKQYHMVVLLKHFIGLHCECQEAIWYIVYAFGTRMHSRGKTTRFSGSVLLAFLFGFLSLPPTYCCFSTVLCWQVSCVGRVWVVMTMPLLLRRLLPSSSLTFKAPTLQYFN